MPGLNILIVDDEPLVSDLIRRKLSRTDPAFSMVSLASAYECLEYIAQNPVDCILSDYQMPGMDGMELLDALRKSGYNTPFIFITGQGNEELAREAFRHGASDYFTKEVGFAHFDRITNSIHQAVSRRMAEDDRAHAERRLAGEKNKLDAIIAGIGDGIGIIDLNYRTLYQNAAYEEMLGTSIGEHCYSALQGRDKVCDGCPVQALFADGKIHRHELTVVKNGRERHIDVTASPLTDTDGNITAAVKVVRDVTEHFDADRRMMESEVMYRLMFEENPVPMWVFDDRTLSIVAVNLAATASYGYSKEEFLSMTVRELRPPEDIPAFMDFIRKNPDRAGSSGAWRHLKKDGTVINVEITSHQLDFKGRKARVVQASDITGRIRMQEELANSERLNRAIVDALPHMVFIMDADGAFIDVRSPDEGSLYVPREAALGKTIDMIFPNNLAEQMMENIASVTKTGEPRSFEYALDMPGGQRRFEARISPLGVDGRLIGVVHDVTECRMAQAGTEAYVERLHQLIDGIPHRAWMKDPGGRLITANRPFLEACGLSLEDVVDRDDRTLWPQDVADYFISSDLHVKQTGRPYSFEEMLKDAEGNEAWFETVKTPFFGARGEFLGTIGIAQDITARKKAELALRDSEARYRTLMEYANDAILIADARTGLLIDVNRKAEELFGYSRGELVGMHQTKLHPPAELERYRGIFEEHVSTGHAITGDLLIQRRDGETVQVEISSSVVEFDGRKIVQGLFRDISERKAIEERLAISEESYREAEAIAGIGNWQWIIERDEVIWSDGMFDIFGLDPAGFGKTYRSFLDYVHPDDKERVMGLVSESLGGKPLDYSTRIICPDGRERVIHVYGRLSCDPAGRPAKLFGTVQDITAQKELETQREELYAMLRHDMRTPLSVISGNADLLMVEQSSVLSPDTLKMLEAIRSGARTLTRMLDDIVAISRLESHNIELMREYVDITEMLLEVSVVASEAARVKGITYTRDFPNDLPQASLNKSYVQRAVANLIDNAVKYTPHDGSITLRADITDNGGGAFIEISVSDTGPGVPMEERARIFEKHYRSRSARPNSGTGLGLAIVKAVAELHGGSIALSSREGAGSIFTLRLPVQGPSSD